ncbi:MAG TPA: DUF4350 domain-containing protein [Terriglobales bacterium]|nr:DUF4350 domain-containing protein [Terriglobales bacterium]
MPMTGTPSDRKLLLGGAVAAAVLSLIAVLAGATRQQDSAWPSSYAAGRGGAKASYLLLEELGYQVERADASPTELARIALPATYILAQPLTAASEEERRAIKEFLTRGGRVLAIGPQAAWTVGASRARFGMPHVVWKTYPRVTASELTRDAAAISTAAESYWEPHAEDGTVVHYSADGEDVVVSYPVGSGEVIWWAGATPLTNNGIQERGNLYLFLNSVGPKQGRRVLWDEYYHGEARTALDSLWSSPLKWGLLQLGLVSGFVLLTYSRRLGPTFVRHSQTRLSPLEFTDALAHLYRRAHAANVSVEVAYERFRHAATRRLGLPHSATAAQISDAFEAQYGAAGARDTIRHAEALRFDPGASELEAIEVVRALHRYTMQVTNVHIRTEGKQ